jgi:hypothetical protein
MIYGFSMAGEEETNYSSAGKNLVDKGGSALRAILLYSTLSLFALTLARVLKSRQDLPLRESFLFYGPSPKAHFEIR